MVYAAEGVWTAIESFLGVGALVVWTAVFPALFGLALFQQLGPRLGASIHAVVAAPVAAHLVLVVRHHFRYGWLPIEEPTVFLSLLATQVFFVYVGAILAESMAQER